MTETIEIIRGRATRIGQLDAGAAEIIARAEDAADLAEALADAMIGTFAFSWVGDGVSTFVTLPFAPTDISAIISATRGGIPQEQRDYSLSGDQFSFDEVVDEGMRCELRIAIRSPVMDESALTPIAVFAWGQSNMSSHIDSTGGDQTLDGDVWLWDQDSTDNDAMIAGTEWLRAAWGVAPLNIGTAPYSNSTALAFAKAKRAETGRPIYLIQIAAGSHHIESFLKAATRTANGWAIQGGNQDLSAFMYPGLAAALALIPNGPDKFDYVIGAQGEANQDEQTEVYAAKLAALHADLLAAGLIDAATPWTLGEFAPTSNNGNSFRFLNALIRAQEDLPTLRIVPSLGAGIIGLGSPHYSGEGLVEMGKRHAQALLAPPGRVNYNFEPMRLGADYGLRSFTSDDNRPNFHIARRPPLALDAALTIEDNATLGWCFKLAANTATKLMSRRVFPVPADGIISISIEALATGGATVDMGLVVYQYDADKVYMSAKTLTPSNSPFADTRTVLRGRFARFGSSAECDILLDTGCEFFAYGLSLGVGANDETFAFNITQMEIIPFVETTIYGFLTVDYALTNTTSTQQAFNFSTNGSLAVTPGIYEFKTWLHMTGMDAAAASNSQFRIAGNATLTNVVWYEIGQDAADALSTGALSGSMSDGTTGNVSGVSGVAAAQKSEVIIGRFEVTAAGTFIPSVKLAVAAAAVMKEFSGIIIRRIGPAGSNVKGNWS